MRFSTRIYNALTCVFFLGALASCGGETKGSKVEVLVLPKTPPVITGSTIDTKGSTIAAPWFGYRLQIGNPTDQPVTIVAFEVTVTGEGDNGEQVSRTTTFTASDWNRTVGEGDNAKTCEYLFFGEFGAGAPAQEIVMDGGYTECQIIPYFLIGGNPKGTTGNNFNYRVKVKPIGWFGTVAEPAERFEKFITFTTR